MFRLIAACLVLFGVSQIDATHAQTYPTKPVRLVAPSIPGGGLDLLARQLASRLSDIWGQAVVVENRPGADFIIGAEAVAKSAPDGYTLLYIPGPGLTVNPLVFPDLSYNPSRDFAPIAVVTVSPFVLAINPNLPARNVQELIGYLKANPGKFNNAYNSVSTRLMSELFKALSGVDYEEVGYRSGAQTVVSTGAGETQMTFADLASAAGPIGNGQLRALAVTTTRRSRTLPDVPTLAEAGVPGYSGAGLTVLVAPAKTPAEIVTKINRDLGTVLQSPELVQRLNALGNEVIFTSAEDAQRELREDSEKWAKLVRERNIKLQNP